MIASLFLMGRITVYNFLHECNIMERINLPNKRLVKSRIITAFLSILIAFSLQLSAKESNQTLVLVGGALTTCASLSPKNCEKNTQISGKTHNVFALSHTKISQIKQQWPSKNSQAKNNTIKNLATMQAKSSPTLSKKELLWLWRAC